LIVCILVVRLMRLLMCIGDTLYVCSHIILLSTPIITDVTKIAHRERVPNGALPIGVGSHSLMGKGNITVDQEEKSPSKNVHLCSINCYENLLLPWVVSVTDTKNYWTSKIIFISLEILFIIHSHSVWLSCKHVTRVYRFVCTVIEIIFHHLQSLCVAGLQWRMIIALAVAITLGDWLLNMCEQVYHCDQRSCCSYVMFTFIITVHHRQLYYLSSWWFLNVDTRRNKQRWSGSHICKHFPDPPVNIIGQDYWYAWWKSLCLLTAPCPCTSAAALICLDMLHWSTVIGQDY